MKNLAELQIRSIGHLDTLKGCGLRVFNSEWLLSNSVSVLSHSLFDSCESKEHMRGVRSQIASVEKQARELLACSVPDTLVHGDLHLGNVGERLPGVGYQFFDWGGCFIGNPFCDFAVMILLQDPEINVEEAEGSYFSFWASYGTKAELRRCAQLACICYCVVIVHDMVKLYERTEVVERVCVLEWLNDAVSTLDISLDDVAGEQSAIPKLYKGSG